MGKSTKTLLILLGVLLALTSTVSAQNTPKQYVIQVSEAFTTLDSTVLAPSNGFRNLMNGMMEPLIRLEPDGKLSPWLATDWAVSDDGLTVTLHLRHDVTFHDGTPFNADAVVWNLEAAMSKDIGNSSAVQLDSVKSVKAIDDYTVQIDLSKPDATFLVGLTGVNSQLFMISPTAYKTMGADNYASHPVGTGPYKFVSWDPGVQVVVERNDHYWGKIGSNADRVIWRVIVDTSAATLNYQSGDIDVMYPAAASELPLLKSVDGTKVQTYPQGYAMLALNNRIPPFDNIHNRRALRYALDVQPVIDLVYGGLAQPAQGFVPPNEYAYNPKVPDVITHDPAKARTELAAAGNPNGYTFEVSVVAQPYRIKTLEIFQASLAEVGITMKIQANERARHLEILRTTPNDANAAFNQQIRFSPTPEDFITVQAGCHPANIFTDYCTDEWKSVYDQLATTTDTAKRTAIIQQLDQMVMRDVIGIPYVYPEVPLVYRGDRLENVKLSGYGLLDWTNINIIGS